MTELLDLPPYGIRDEVRLLAEMNELVAHHHRGCPVYRVMSREGDAPTIEEVAFLHVGVFKSLSLRTEGEDIIHQRDLLSSATSSGISSVISLDSSSSELQSKSVTAILADYIGDKKRPLLVLDSPRSLRGRGGISARIAAAMSLQRFAESTSFLIPDMEDIQAIEVERIISIAENHDDLIVYGFTWILWNAWGNNPAIEAIRDSLRGKRISFVHSGGWKRLESERIDRDLFDSSLLEGLHPGSKVIDYYGLVEQVGVIYPQCEHGHRHVPIWADVIVRDPWTSDSLIDEIGQIQLLNLLARGSPYHSILTEDLGIIISGACPCGRSGKRFDLIGRVPKAEIRGCANV